MSDSARLSGKERLGPRAARRAMDVFRWVCPWDLHMDDTRSSSRTALADTLNAPGAVSVESTVPALMADLGRRARQAARWVALASPVEKDAALRAMAAAIRARAEVILAANDQDLAEARARGQNPAFIDRLALDPGRLEAVATAVESVAGLPDPVGRLL